MSNVHQPTEGTSPGYMDRAETFDETDLTTTVTNLNQVSEGFELPGYVGNTTSRDNDNETIPDDSREAGIVINPNKELGGVRVNISSMVSGFTTAYLRNHSDGSLIDSKDVSSLINGETVEFMQTLNSGSDYRLTLDADGSPYTIGRTYNGSAPVSGTDLDIIAGIADGNTSTTYIRNLNDATSLVNDSPGEVICEWPYPDDVAGWDMGLFQTNPDGETVSVYVEETTNGGSTWTEIAGPISDGDDLPGNSANNLRFRVEISRSNMLKNPRLEAIYRRWMV